jgi:putative spermidine/putrescine transport system permease protein
MQVNATDRVMAWAGSIVRPLVYLALTMPAIIVVISSFTAGERLNFPPEGFSLRWYYAAFGSEAFMSSLLMSLRLACLTTFGAIILGMCAAFALDRYEFPGKVLFRTLALSSLIIPTVVIGLGLLQFLAWVGWTQPFARLLAGHVLITIPYVVRTVSASLILFDRNLEQAAMNLRARPWKVFLRITIPMLAPAIVASAVFVFVTSFGNISLSIFLGFSGQATLPVAIFTYLETSYNPILAAISTLVIVVTVLVVALVAKLTGMEKVS